MGISAGGKKEQGRDLGSVIIISLWPQRFFSWSCGGKVPERSGTGRLGDQLEALVVVQEKVDQETPITLVSDNRDREDWFSVHFT